MRAQKYLPKYNVDDYKLWDGDWELIDGIAYALSPSATFGHQNLASELNAEIRSGLKKIKEHCSDCTVVQGLDWIIDDNTVVRPDLVVICNQSGKYITSPPAIVIELLSPSTAFKDRNLKYEIYEEQGVPYYIIIDPQTNQFETFVLEAGRYVSRDTITSFNVSSICSVEIDLQVILSAF